MISSDLSDITKNILCFYNTKYNKLDLELKKIEQKKIKTGIDLSQKMWEKLLVCDKNNDNKPDDFNKNPENLCKTTQDIDITNIICKINIISDKNFIEKMILYRKLEIEKKVKEILFLVSFQKYLHINHLYLQNFNPPPNKQSDYKNLNDNINSVGLKNIKFLYTELCQKYEILRNKTFCKYIFTEDRYNKLVKSV
jgi:hypothetical protein